MKSFFMGTFLIVRPKTHWLTYVSSTGSLHGDADKSRLQCLLQENETNSPQNERYGPFISRDDES